MIAMAESVRTEGERQFEAYLDSVRYKYEFEKSYPGRAKKPDYTITANQVLLADVKDFDQLLPNIGFQQVDVHFRIRKKIEDGRKKFKEYKDFTCCVVLQNNGNVHVPSEDPTIVLGSMYGSVGFAVPVFVGDGVAPAKLPEPTIGFMGDAQMTATKNTTISALLSLRQVAVGVRRMRKIRKEITCSVDEAIATAGQRFENFDYDEKQLGVIVWENCHARLPLSRELFVGPYDERWGLAGSDIQRVFCGQGVSDLEGETG
jgi:hypothetical protein